MATYLHHLHSSLVGIVLVALHLTRPAAAIEPGSAELQKIAEEREAAESRYRTRAHECQQRFFVTSCVDDAKRERRGVMERLRARQRAIDETRRRERATARSAALRQKAAEDAKREADHSARAAGDATAPEGRRRRGIESRRDPNEAPRRQTPKDTREPPSPIGSGRSRPPQPSAAERQELETRSRAIFESRQRQAAEHREEIIDRETRRALQRPPAAPLPVPDAASAARPTPLR